MYEKEKNAKPVAKNYPRQCAEKAFKKYSRNYATNVARKYAISMQIMQQLAGQKIIYQRQQGTWQESMQVKQQGTKHEYM